MPKPVKKKMWRIRIWSKIDGKLVEQYPTYFRAVTKEKAEAVILRGKHNNAAKVLAEEVK